MRHSKSTEKSCGAGCLEPVSLSDQIMLIQRFCRSLFYFYFFYSTIRLATPDNSRIRWALVKIVGMAQWILLPGLLIWSMNRFAVDANNSGNWVARTFDGKRAQNSSIKEWIFGSGGLLEMLTVGTWDKVLRYSTPFFQLAEGFCSLLVIQAAGQITRWLVNRRRSDTWMVWSTLPRVNARY